MEEMKRRTGVRVVAGAAVLALATLLGTISCSSFKHGTKPGRVELGQGSLVEADDLFLRGDHASLLRAAELYGALAPAPRFRADCREKLLKTLLLLAVRDKELGVLDATFLRKAHELIKAYPDLASYMDRLRLIRVMRTNVSGIMGEGSAEDAPTLEIDFEWAKKNAARLNANLQAAARTDPFSAYLCLAVQEEFANWIAEKPGYAAFQGAEPSSPLVRFKLSLVPRPDRDKLDILLRESPGFVEARLFLGLDHLARGRVVPAEEEFLQVFRAHPRSLAGLMGLARVRFYFEEFSASLQAFQDMLMIAPHYREALLGKAVCLSLLERREEALRTCREIRELGMYYLGESHFWSAQNLFAQGELDSALGHIGETEKYLYGKHEVLLLAGKIFYALGDGERASEKFKEVLKIRPSDGESAFLLGKISSEKGAWLEAGSWFETSAGNGLAAASAVEERAREIGESDLSEERKARLLQKRSAEIEKIRLETATAFYNAAAGYFNAGLRDKAIECAGQAQAHPRFQSLAAELIKKL